MEKEIGGEPEPENENGAVSKAAIADLLSEGRDSKRKKFGILTLGLVLAAWIATWVVFKSLLFGWIPAVIIVMVVRAVFWNKPKKFGAGTQRRK